MFYAFVNVNKKLTSKQINPGEQTTFDYLIKKPEFKTKLQDTDRNKQKGSTST